MTVLTPAELTDCCFGIFFLFSPQIYTKIMITISGPDVILEVRKPWILAFASCPVVFTRWIILGGLKSRILTLISNRKLVKNKPV